MDNDVEQKIRQRAYELWVEGGQVSGRSDEYWLQAEREILGTPNEGDTTLSTPQDAAGSNGMEPQAKPAGRASGPRTASKSTKAAATSRPKRTNS